MLQSHPLPSLIVFHSKRCNVTLGSVFIQVDKSHTLRRQVGDCGTCLSTRISADASQPWTMRDIRIATSSATGYNGLHEPGPNCKRLTAAEHSTGHSQWQLIPRRLTGQGHSATVS